MKVSLLFPPTWHPSQPYLSLPSLTGFLAQAGVTNVTQRDLGIELLDEVVTKSYGVGLYQELLDKKLEVISTVYFPTRLTVVDNQFSTYSIYSSKDLMKVIRDEQQNPYIRLFRERFLPSIIADRPELIGVSITATSQIIPGLTLCRLIKETAPDIHLTIGGSIFTRLVDNLRRCPNLFDITDDIVVFEGETALLELVNQMAGKKDFSRVPNLIYRQNGKINVNQQSYSETG